MLNNQYKTIKKSGLFDDRYYLKHYEDIRKLDIDPIKHYLDYGWKEGRNPSDRFDTNFYLESYPDIKNNGMNPLVHFIKYGIKEGRQTHQNNSIYQTTKKETKIVKVMKLIRYVKQNPHLLKKFYNEVRNNGFLYSFKKAKAKFITFNSSETQYIDSKFSILKSQEKESILTSWYNNNLKANNNFTPYNNLLDLDSFEKTYLVKFQNMIRTKKIVSFDIFDTLLERTLISPHSVFSYIEYEAKRKNIINFNFKTMRIEAELIARKNSQYEEITLDDIYNVIGSDFGVTKETTLYLKESELALETKVLSKRLLGKKLYEIAQKEKKQIIFISDMYLSKDFLISILNNQNYNADSSNVYVSCEEKTTKHSGSLFLKIKEEKDIDPSLWIHVGDNLYSDIYIPEKLGICTFFIKNSSQHLLNNYKMQTLWKDNLGSRDEVIVSSILGTIANKFYGRN